MKLNRERFQVHEFENPEIAALAVFRNLKTAKLSRNILRMFGNNIET